MGYKQLQETSIETYHKLIEEGVLGKMQAVALEVIAKNPDCTDRELCESARDHFEHVAHWTARRNELWHKGLIEQSGKRQCGITGRSAMTWRINENQDQLTLW